MLDRIWRFRPTTHAAVGLKGAGVGGGGGACWKALTSCVPFVVVPHGRVTLPSTHCRRGTEGRGREGGGGLCQGRKAGHVYFPGVQSRVTLLSTHCRREREGRREGGVRGGGGGG
jgi:hypothetical protein